MRATGPRMRAALTIKAVQTQTARIWVCVYTAFFVSVTAGCASRRSRSPLVRPLFLRCSVCDPVPSASSARCLRALRLPRGRGLLECRSAVFPPELSLRAVAVVRHQGISLAGHDEILIPLIAAALA